MLVTCFSTARRVTNRRSAIAWFERPSAISSSTSRSRGESSSSGSSRRCLPDELADDGRIERRAALGDAPDGRGELLHVGHAVLEQVADALGALREELHRVARLDVLGEDEHAGGRVPLADLLRRAQPFVGLGRRHPDVDDRDIGLVHRDVAQQVLGVSRLRDDVEAGVPEQARDSLAQEHGVVGEHDADGRGAGPRAQRREVAAEARLLELEDALRARAGRAATRGRGRAARAPGASSAAAASEATIWPPWPVEAIR